MYHLGQLDYSPLKLNLQFLRTVTIWKFGVQNLHLTKKKLCRLLLRTRVMWT